MSKNTCPLCKLAQGDIKTNLYFEGHKYMIVDCLSCKVPMVVVREHRELTPADHSEISFLVHELFGDGFWIRWVQRKIMDHGHCHIMGCLQDVRRWNSRGKEQEHDR